MERVWGHSPRYDRCPRRALLTHCFAHQIDATEAAFNVAETTKELGPKGSVSLAKAICRCIP